MDRNISKYITLTVLLLFALVFIGLSVDVMVRLWTWRARFPSLLDVALIFFLESVRCCVILAGVVVAVLAVRGRQRAAFPLAFAVVFATIAYAKLSAFAAFPGDVQERAALWLGARGVTPEQLLLVFGHAEWAAWLALGGLLLFAAHYPRAITVHDVAQSGLHDRTGAMRSVALAGADVGALARRLATAAVRQDWLRPGPVWLSATLLAVAHTALRVATGSSVVIDVTALVIALVVSAVAIVLIRAGMLAADEKERPLLLWLRRGVLYGGALFAAGALFTQLLPALPLGAVTLSIAPVATAICCLIAVRARV